MKLYLISQSVNNDWDTYDSAVVAATSESEAALICPNKHYLWKNGSWNFIYSSGDVRPDNPRDWCAPENVKVSYLGEACEGVEHGVVIASYNAG